MEQQSSTSKVTVEYFDPHDVYKLLAPGLVPRLPLHNLHWQSHAGPLRSIDTLHVELVPGETESATPASAPAPPSASSARDDGFQTQNVGGRTGSTDTVDTQSLPSRAVGSMRRHQIPGLRRTPYLKVLLVRCDDNDSYKSTVRAEVREWVKTHTPPSSSSKKTSNQEKHDASEWLIVHVVIPNTVAATQPRNSGSKSDTSTPDKTSSSRWRTGATPLMEKLRSDFNSSGKGAVDRVTQIRIGINDVPYDVLPRVVPAVPSGYVETEQDAENAWNELIAKLKSQILSSFDMRVTQYEEDIKEKDTQRALPGWNFCTFFILKEGLARGFENVGLVEDALVGYDELSVGLDSVLHEQAETGSPESHGGAILSYTEELRAAAEKAVAGLVGDEEAVDLQSKETTRDQVDEILISSTKKAYRDMILANKVSVFDFRCYIFARQVALLLRLGNASSSREELLAKLKEQQESVLHGVAPLAPPPPKQEAQTENLAFLAEICRRTLQFVPLISSVMRQDIFAAMQGSDLGQGLLTETVDNMAASFSFSVAQQILAQTATKVLPIPPSSLTPADGSEPKAWIPEPKTMMHPARSSSMHIRPTSRPPPSPGVFPGPGRRASVSEGEVQNAQFLKAGLEELAAKRAELYIISRSILEGMGKKRGWSNGWDEAPMMGDPGIVEMAEISLDDDSPPKDPSRAAVADPSMAGVDGQLLRAAIDNSDDFYRLYEILTDKALRHYAVANHEYAVHASTTDLAVLKVHMKEYRAAAALFRETTPFFSASGWSVLELSMLIMYSRCVSELRSREDYISAALKLLIKACAAEKERLEQKSVLLKGQKRVVPDMSPVSGVVSELLSSPLPNEVEVPLVNLFTLVEVVGAPEYHEKRDSCSISIQLWSLLPDEITLDGISLKATCTDGGPCKEISFQNKDETVLQPGKNIVKVDCQSVVPGHYSISSLALSASNLVLSYKRDNNAPAEVFRHPEIALFQRTGALDVQLTATKHIVLDKNNSLDLELSTGWNTLKSCELRVRPATGGLRLLTHEAKFVDSSREFAKPPEAGVFTIDAVDQDTSVVIRFPYSVENDVGDVAARLEVSYVTESGAFYLAKSLAIPVALAVGVNVQDVFKHQALFSRFNVSTASSSPIRLYKSELIPSDLFESDFGVPPTTAVIIFPKQAASLLYKIKRKTAAKAGKRTGKTMYLKLHYSQLQTEIEELVARSLSQALEETPLKWYSRLALGCVSRELKKALQAQGLERAALLGQLSTAFLAGVPWEQHFKGIGTVHGSLDDAGVKLSALLRDWQTSHPRIPIPASNTDDPSTILIPVEIPSLPIVHTADIKLHTPLPSLVAGPTPTVRTNQMLPATLHLKWTRVWDSESAAAADQEFSYEVSAPADSWLLGGRRKGHFVIPASSGVASTAETEAEIPLILIPQRDGWLPYPTVEVKEIAADGDVQTCEVDWRNLGETVRVSAERKGVTVSLDASGSGGGPLVLESEGWGREGRVIV